MNGNLNMNFFIIEKYVGSNNSRDLKSTDGHAYHDWKAAFGLNKRSWPNTSDEKEAIKIFVKETLKMRKSKCRLVSLMPGAFGPRSGKSIVLASINCSDSKKLPVV